MMRHVPRGTAFLAGLLLAAAGAWAQSSPSHFPAATQPLNGADAVLMDQGSGCAAGIQPCATKNSPSTRVGQPVQQTTAPTTPFAYQQWIDTSVSPPQLKMYIGSSWFTVAALDSTDGFEFNVPASAVTGLGTMATQNANAVAITGGSITGMSTPTASSDVATKLYVDGKASGIVFQQAVDYATAAILPNTPVYANGTLGVGRTLTAGSNTTLTVDGTVAILTKRVLVKNQSDQTQNGCYSVTTAGGGVPWVLTGCTDWDQSAEMQTGSYFIVTAGATNAATSWVLNTTGTVVVGSTPLAFVQSGASNIYTAGTGLTLAGAVFSITNTGVANATYGSATQVPQIALNLQGQATTATNVAIAIPASSLTNGTTGSGAVMLAASPTTTGTLTTASIVASGLIFTASTFDATGHINTANQFQVGGVPLAALHLSNGVTGSGAVMLAASPTATGTLSNDGGATGQTTYYLTRSATNKAAFYLPASSSDPVLWAGANAITLTQGTGALKFNAYGAGALYTDGSGNVSASGANTISGNGVLKVGGVIIEWGTTSFSSASSSAVTFPTAFSNIYSVTCTFSAGQYCSSGSVTTSGFSAVLSGSSTGTGYWIAIGS